jgi:hypothetical protein
VTQPKRAEERVHTKVDLGQFVDLAHEVQLAGDLTLGPALAELTGLKISQVRYYLRAARRKGLKVDLDHTPTEAVIYRNSAKQKEWQVCRTCLVPWPCQVTAHRVSA